MNKKIKSNMKVDYKSENGIGFIGVIILIVIILAVAGVVIYLLELKYNEEKIETIKTNMLKISWKTAEILEKAKVSGTDPEYVGTKMSEMIDDERLRAIKENNIIAAEDYDKYYVITDEDIEKLGIENVKNEDDSLYLLNYDNTGEIYISKGFGYLGRDKFYKLSDIKVEKEKIESEKNKNEEKNEEVVEEVKEETTEESAEETTGE